MKTRNKYGAIVIGASAGGIEACKHLLKTIQKELDIPVLIVQHIMKDKGLCIADLMSKLTGLKTKEAEPGEDILPNTVYFAPPDYHMAVEQDKTITLLSTEPINYSRPSIDVLFEAAADAYTDRLLGVILTGSSSDGADGLKRINKMGGCTIVQSPEDAEFDVMPLSAMENTNIDFVGTIKEITEFIREKLKEFD
jgi:two-component system chemotaxis response regulator CheB